MPGRGIADVVQEVPAGEPGGIEGRAGHAGIRGDDRQVFPELAVMRGIAQQPLGVVHSLRDDLERKAERAEQRGQRGPGGAERAGAQIRQVDDGQVEQQGGGPETVLEEKNGFFTDYSARRYPFRAKEVFLQTEKRVLFAEKWGIRKIWLKEVL